MRYGLLILFLFGFSLSLGCKSAAVHVQTPIGDRLDKASLAKFEGAWMLEDLISMQVHQTSKGELKFCISVWDDETETFETGQEVAIPTRVGEFDFLFVSDKENASGELEMMTYRWDTPNKLVVSRVETSVFEELVNKGKLKGKVDKNAKHTHVLLECSAQELEALMESDGFKKSISSRNSVQLVKMRAQE